MKKLLWLVLVVMTLASFEQVASADSSDLSILTKLEDAKNILWIILFIIIGLKIVQLPFKLLGKKKFPSKYADKNVNSDDLLVINKYHKRKLKRILKRLCIDVFAIKAEDVQLFERDNHLIAEAATLFGRFVLTINFITPTTVSVKQQESEPVIFQLNDQVKEKIQAHYQFDWANF